MRGVTLVKGGDYVKVTTTVNPITGMIEKVTEVPPCDDSKCLAERMREHDLIGYFHECYGECQWVDGYGDWSCYE